MKEFNQYGTLLTREEAKEIRGGRIHSLSIKEIGQEAGGDGSGDCRGRNPCEGSCHVAGAGSGTCHAFYGNCVCLTPM